MSFCLSLSLFCLLSQKNQDRQKTGVTKHSKKQWLEFSQFRQKEYSYRFKKMHEPHMVINPQKFRARPITITILTMNRKHRESSKRWQLLTNVRIISNDRISHQTLWSGQGNRQPVSRAGRKEFPVKNFTTRKKNKKQLPGMKGSQDILGWRKAQRIYHRHTKL